MIVQEMPVTGSVTQDRADLERLCRTIREGDSSLWKAQCAASEICQRGLWAGTGVSSATEFFKVEFGYERTYVSRLKKIGVILPMLKKLPVGQPTAERQIRPLIKLLKVPEQLQEAWQKASEAAGGVPSASLVEAEVEKRVPRKEKEAPVQIDEALRSRVTTIWEKMAAKLRREKDAHSAYEVLRELMDKWVDEIEGAA